MDTVFVYGTLTDPGTAERVLPDHAFRGSAVLRGLHRVDGDYPTLAPGGSVPGRLLATAHLDALDAYEGVDQGLYARVSVPLAGDAVDDAGTDAVDVYVGDPDRLRAAVTWPGDSHFPACVREYVADHDVRVVHEGAGDRGADAG